MSWEGPRKLRELLDREGGLEARIVPEAPGLYVFSLEPWQQAPEDLLYLGSGHATKNTNLRHRVGAEVASTLGFWGKVAGHGHGGILLSEYCRKKGINPLDLRLGWLILPQKSCPVPCEKKLHARHDHNLSPHLLNDRRVNSCGLKSCGKRPCGAIAQGFSSCAHCYSF
jgi:hypothetical protein